MLSVVAAAYNEEGVLAAFIERTVAVLDAAGADWELVLVDDGSSDST